MSRSPDERVLRAPPELGLETRQTFRQEAFRLLDGMLHGTGRLTIDLGATRRVDSTGFNALILIRRHAATRRIAVRLVGVGEEIHALLLLAKLDTQFEIERA